MKKCYFLPIVLLLGNTSSAQEAGNDEEGLDRTVVVENLYNPEVMDASKIGMLPTPEVPVSTKKEVRYAATYTPFTNFAQEPLACYGTEALQGVWRDADNGYLRLGYGTRGRVDARLAYQATLGERDWLDANLTFRGMNGEIPFQEGEHWDARVYRTRLQAGWKHLWGKCLWGLSGEGESRVFNYPPLGVDVKSGRQQNLLGRLSLGIENKEQDAELDFDLSLAWEYARQKHVSESGACGENHLITVGNLSGQLAERSRIGLGVRMDNLFYSGAGSLSGLKNYTLLGFNPALYLSGEKWQARLGLHADIQTANGKLYRMAPDVRGEYHMGKTSLVYLQATGGYQINDFRTVSSLYPYVPYFQPASEMHQPRNTYTRADLQLGYGLSAQGQFHLKVYGGYKVLADELFNVYDPVGGTNSCLTADANVFYVGAHSEYNYKEKFSLLVDVEWMNWQSDVMDVCPTLKPELDLSLEAECQPIRHLHVGAGYHHVLRSKGKAHELRPKAVSNLQAHVSYRLLPALTLYIRGDNLLDKAYELQLFQPALGWSLLGGASLDF